MNLSQILSGIDVKKILGNHDFDALGVAYSSKKVVKNGMFVCLSGANFDGHDFVDDALKNGAKVVVSEVSLLHKGITNVVVNNTREALAKISANFWGHPAKRLTTIGITGTKGKTTVACLIKSIIEKTGQKCGMIGTLGMFDGKTLTALENTTPESLDVQRSLFEMAQNGCSHVVIEATSLGLKHHRLDGFTFDYGVFTNFSKDHIGTNEHSDMDDYIASKSLLFKKCKIGLINQDDIHHKTIVNGCTCEIKTFGTSESSNIFASDMKLVRNNDILGSFAKIRGEANFEIDIPIPGKFNVYNALAAISVCKLLKIDDQKIIDGIKNLKVKGRTELVKTPFDFTLMIDFAHNAVSIQNILSTLREYNPNRLIILFGAGGGRSKTRRYEVGEICGNLADFSIITSDNSRFENVLDIIEDIKIGMHKTKGEYIAIPDRKEAIRYAITHARKGDIVVLAGKGHEDYQEISGVKHPFDERIVIKEIINSL